MQAGVNATEQCHSLNSFAMWVSQNAVKALLYEVAVTPKPGLVDRSNNGSHNDMDFFTFINSSCALFSYFYDITVLGMKYEGEAENMLDTLRARGIKAEKEMLLETGGINTHKGMIFSMGILCAARGWLCKKGCAGNAGLLLETAGKIASAAIRDFENSKTCAGDTNGKKLYSRHGLEGIRGEAAAGFPAVANIAYPKMKQLFEEGYSYNDAGSITLFYLMAKVQDTNIISRSDLKTHSDIQKGMNVLTEKLSGRELLEAAKSVDDVFIGIHVSPGGCADLLAITFFLVFMFE